MKLYTKLNWIFILIAVITVSSCVKKEPTTRIAQVFFAPLSPNAGAVNFAMGSNIFATQVLYPQTATNNTVAATTVRYAFPYFTLEPQSGTISYNVQTTNLPLASITGVTLEDEKTYSTFLIDSVSKARAIIVNDDLEVPTPGFFKVRFYNFCPNAPAVNVNILGDTTVRWRNRTFETQATASANEKFMELTAGTYTFEIRNAATNAVITTVTSQAYLTERIYTIAVRGFIGGTGNQLVAGWLYPNLP